MKLVKLSLAAAMLMGASAYAEVKNVDFYGNGKIWYQTNDVDGSDNGLFNQKSSIGDVSMVLGVKADAGEHVKVNAEATMLSTLGLQYNLVSGVAATTSTEDQMWMSIANIAYTGGKTTAIIGRQALNTPMAFTETWNAVNNTFDAAVVVNGDIPDTTIVGAWVGLSDSAANGKTVNTNGEFVTYPGVDPMLEVTEDAGAYAAAVVYSGIKDATLQAWVYNVQNYAYNYWLQADAKVAVVDLGVQYSIMNEDQVLGNKDNNILALRVGGNIAGVSLFGAYSTTSNEGGTLGFANVGTFDKTKIYTGTASIYADGVVTAPDTDAWKIGAGYTIKEVGLKANFTDWETTGKGNNAWDISANTNIGGVNLKAIYTQVSYADGYVPSSFNQDVINPNGAESAKDRSSLRIVTTLPF
jgi:imipenem/basic amino acid-specific outer membrane pore